MRAGAPAEQCIGDCGWVFLQPERASQASLPDVVAEADLGCPSLFRAPETQELVRLPVPSHFGPVAPPSRKSQSRSQFTSRSEGERRPWLPRNNPAEEVGALFRGSAGMQRARGCVPLCGLQGHGLKKGSPRSASSEQVRPVGTRPPPSGPSLSSAACADSDLLSPQSWSTAGIGETLTDALPTFSLTPLEYISNVRAACASPGGGHSLLSGLPLGFDSGPSMSRTLRKSAGKHAGFRTGHAASPPPPP